MKHAVIAGFFTMLVGGAPAMELVELAVTNPTTDPWVEAPVIIRNPAHLDVIANWKVLAHDQQANLVQHVDLNKDGKIDEAVFLPSIHPGVTEVFHAMNAVSGIPNESRVHAGMYVEGFEGPGWESDLLAFRLYWDARNATDIFCKREPLLGLREYAKPEVNYHLDTPWGMDVLKVGTALGAGGFAIWHNGKVEKVSDATRDYEVLADGPLEAVMDLKYTDWKVADRTFNLTVRIRVIAGQRFADYELWLVPTDGGPMPEVVVGIVKHEGTTLLKDETAGFVGRWGKQALGPGETPNAANLGLGVTTDPAHIVAIEEDEVNTFIRIRTTSAKPPVGMGGNGGYATYRAHASWEHEPAGAQNATEYGNMLRRTARLHPVVKINTPAASTNAASTN